MESILRFFRRIIFSYKQSSIMSDWKTYMMFDLIPPISQTLLFSLIAGYIYGTDYIQKWMIGNAILITSFGALFGVGTQLMDERYNGTLSFLIASKTKLSSILFSSAISSMLTSMVSVTIGIVLVSMILKISWNIGLIASFFIVLLVASFVAMSFGYIFSCFILVTSEVNLMLNLASRILLIFTGANFPISRLPHFLQFIPKLLPLTRSIEVAQGVIEGKTISTYYLQIFEEIVLGIIFIIFASILLRVMENVSRRNSTIELV
ncbi:MULTISPECIES: ABC transporter permease [Streptococcus]|jgi:ABC-2 type transport system permease protein|uniref:ABC transporter permease n=1 Tax=Streptococcus TaxID=1301 RepID=UPI0028BDA28B|nr:ABC transporter permease [Streptococcus parasanguinis]WNN31506.1 ABC transporter permease [Streptococcus parasanguinis]